jgi:hypothetical protein
MSGHADTIRKALTGGSPAFQREARDESLAALAELVAEKQRLRDALTLIANRDFGGHLLSPDEAEMRETARRALAATPSEDT